MWKETNIILQENSRDRTKSNLRCFIPIVSKYYKSNVNSSGPGSSVCIATTYGLDGAGIESRWGEIFRTFPDQPWGPPSLLYNGYRVFPGGTVLLGRDADPSPPSSAEV